MTDDLIAFLRARLDEDEQVAVMMAALGGPGSGDPMHWNVEYIARWDPARVLAEVEAKRRMLDYLVKLADIAIADNLWNLDYEQPFKLMALPHARHPDYRPEWRPAE